MFTWFYLLIAKILYQMYIYIFSKRQTSAFTLLPKVSYCCLGSTHQIVAKDKRESQKCKSCQDWCTKIKNEKVKVCARARASPCVSRTRRTPSSCSRRPCPASSAWCCTSQISTTCKSLSWTCWWGPGPGLPECSKLWCQGSFALLRCFKL